MTASIVIPIWMLRGTWNSSGGACVELFVMLTGMEIPVGEKNYRYYFGRGTFENF